MAPIDNPQLLAATLIVGTMIGFVISCLWEWLYYRGRRAENIDKAVAAAVAEVRASRTPTTPPPGPVPSESAYSPEDYYDDQTALLDYETDEFRQGAAVAVSRQTSTPITPPQTVAVQPAPANYAAIAAATGATIAAVAASGNNDEPPPLRTTTAGKAGAKQQTSAQDLFNYELSAYREVTGPPPLVEKPPVKAQTITSAENDPSAVVPLVAAGAAAMIAKQVHDGHEQAEEPANSDEEPVRTSAAPVTQPELPETASTTVEMLPGTRSSAPTPDKALAAGASRSGLPSTAGGAQDNVLPGTAVAATRSSPAIASQTLQEPPSTPDRSKAIVAATAAAATAAVKTMAADDQATTNSPTSSPEEAPLHPGGDAAAGVPPITTPQPEPSRGAAVVAQTAEPPAMTAAEQPPDSISAHDVAPAATRAVGMTAGAAALADDQETVEEDEALWSDAEAAPDVQLEASEPEPFDDDEARWSDADATPELQHEPIEPEPFDDDEARWSDADATPELQHEPIEPEPFDDDEARWSDAEAEPQPSGDTPTAEQPHHHTARKAAAAAGIAHAAHKPASDEPVSAPTTTQQSQAATPPGAAASGTEAAATPQTPAPSASTQGAGEAVSSTPTASRSEPITQIEPGATPQVAALQTAAPVAPVVEEAAPAPSTNAPQREEDDARPGVTAAILAAGGAAIAGIRKALRNSENPPQPQTDIPASPKSGEYQNGKHPTNKVAPDLAAGEAEDAIEAAPSRAQEVMIDMETGEITEAPADRPAPEFDEGEPGLAPLSGQPLAPELVEELADDTEVAASDERDVSPLTAMAAVVAAQVAEESREQDLYSETPEPAPDAERNIEVPFAGDMVADDTFADDKSATPAQLDDLVTSVHELINRMDQKEQSSAVDNASPQDAAGSYTARNLSRTEYATVRLMQQTRLTIGEITGLFKRKPAAPSNQPDDLTRIPTLTAAHAERLHMAGVTSYQKLAGLSTEELEMLFLVPTGDPNPDFSVWLIAARGLA